MGKSVQYARVKELQYDMMCEELDELTDKAVEIRDKEMTNALRLKIDTLKWKLSKLAPKKYGDRLDLNHGGQVDNPIIGDIIIK